MSTISHVQLRAPKTVLLAQNFVCEKLKFMKACIWQNSKDSFFFMIQLYFYMQEIIKKMKIFCSCYHRRNYSFFMSWSALYSAFFWKHFKTLQQLVLSGFNHLKSIKPSQADNLLLTTKFPEIPQGVKPKTGRCLVQTPLSVQPGMGTQPPYKAPGNLG